MEMMATARALVNILLNPRCESCGCWIQYDDDETMSRTHCHACEEDRGLGNIPGEEEEDETEDCEMVSGVVVGRQVARFAESTQRHHQGKKSNAVI
jgi:hypothetical protein